MADDEKKFEKSSDNGASEVPIGGERPETKGIRLLPVFVMILILATTAGAWGWLWSEKKANTSVVAQFETEPIENEKCRGISLVLSEAEANVPAPGDPAKETETANSKVEKYDPKKRDELPNTKSRTGISELPLSPAVES